MKTMNTISGLPYLLVGIICIGETTTFGRKRPESALRDRGSYWVITIFIAAGYYLAFQIKQISFGSWALWFGGALTLSGTAFRLWSIRTLGQYFTRTVQVSSDQKVIEAGPYRYIRHPSYTGAIIAAAGVGLSLRHWLSLALILIPMTLSLAYRILVEERALIEALGKPYKDYMARTKRLIPFLL